MFDAVTWSRPWLDPRQRRNFIFLPAKELGRDDEVELRSLVSAPDVPGLNPKYLCSTFL